MKITLIAPGRFHTFNEAQQLLKRNYLCQLITSYPKSEVVKYGIPKDKVSSVLIKEILWRGWEKLPEIAKSLYNPQFLVLEIFDILASKYLKKSDIVVGGTSVFLHTLKQVRRMGAIAVVGHGSSHIVYQNDILKEEYEKYRIKIKPYQLPHPKIIEKEIIEYEEVDYILIPSEFVRRTFIKKGIPEEKLIQIPYGVELSQFKQIPKGDDVFRVVFAGGMTLRKGIHYLLQAFAELNLPNSELMLIGSITDEIKPFLKKYEGKFNYIGRKPQSELYKYYSQSSVFVMMSIEEGMALVQLQAMACGLPVICTTNTGGEDIIRGGSDGFIIPIRDVEKLKEQLTYLYENPGICRQMGQSAKERVSSGFTWDDYGEKLVAAYQRILKKANKSFYYQGINL